MPGGRYLWRCEGVGVVVPLLGRRVLEGDRLPALVAGQLERGDAVPLERQQRFLRPTARERERESERMIARGVRGLGQPVTRSQGYDRHNTSSNSVISSFSAVMLRKQLLSGWRTCTIAPFRHRFYVHERLMVPTGQHKTKATVGKGRGSAHSHRGRGFRNALRLCCCTWIGNRFVPPSPISSVDAVP